MHMQTHAHVFAKLMCQINSVIYIVITCTVHMVYCQLINLYICTCIWAYLTQLDVNFQPGDKLGQINCLFVFLFLGFFSYTCTRPGL